MLPSKQWIERVSYATVGCRVAMLPQCSNVWTSSAMHIIHQVPQKLQIVNSDS
jgi:hypothetical protein